MSYPLGLVDWMYLALSHAALLETRISAAYLDPDCALIGGWVGQSDPKCPPIGQGRNVERHGPRNPLPC